MKQKKKLKKKMVRRKKIAQSKKKKKISFFSCGLFSLVKDKREYRRRKKVDAISYNLFKILLTSFTQTNFQ